MCTAWCALLLPELSSQLSNGPDAMDAVPWPLCLVQEALQVVQPSSTRHAETTAAP